MFNFNVRKNEMELIESETLTSGSIGAYTCHFDFSDDWKDLAKTVTFRAGDKKVSVIIDESNECGIPREVLTENGLELYVGVIGAAGVETEDYEDDIVIPTVWTLLGIIRKGASVGEGPDPSSPDIYDQIMIEIASLRKNKQDKLTAGDNITIDDNVISATVSDPYDDTEIKAQLEEQDALIMSVQKSTDDNTEEIGNINADLDDMDQDISELQAAVSAKQDTLTAGKNINISESNVISADTYDDTDIKKQIDDISAESAANTAAINVLNGDGEGSVKKTTADAVAEIVAGAPEDFDTLKEMSDWIYSHEDNAAEMNSAIQKNKEDIAANTAAISDLEENISEISENKQNKLTAGTNIEISDDGVISATGGDSYDDTEIKEEIAAINDSLDNKQDKLTAGTNIEISDDGVISAIGGESYDDTEIKEEIAKISDDLATVSESITDIQENKQNKLTAGTNIEISDDGVISATGGESYDDTEIKEEISAISDAIDEKQNKLTAGENVTISDDGVISTTDTVYDDTEIKEYIEAISDDLTTAEENIAELAENKQNKLTAGDNIEISEDGVISATDTVYDDTEIKEEISALSDSVSENTEAITTLNGTGEGSVKKIAADAVAEIVADAPEDFDTLKEMSDWIYNHEDSAAAMNAAIQSNTSEISQINADLSAQGELIDTVSETTAANTDAIGSINDSIGQINTSLSNKQDKLTAGNNVNISDDGVISATDTVYDDTEIREELSSINEILDSVSTGRGCVVGPNDSVTDESLLNNPLYKVASINISDITDDTFITFKVTIMDQSEEGYAAKLYTGILTAYVKMRNGSYDDTSSLTWEYANNNFDTGDFLALYDGNRSTFEIWYIASSRNGPIHFDVLSEGIGESRISNTWTLYDNVGEGAVNDVEYTSIVHSQIMSLRNYVNSATYAYGDNLRQRIDSTYIKSLEISDNSIIYTKGNGTTGIAGTIVTTDSYDDTEIKAEINSLSEDVEANTAEINSLSEDVEANTAAINVLNGTGEGSVKKTAADAVAEIVANAPEDFDTLKEMSDWIYSHENSAAEMNSAIQANTENISDNTSDINSLKIKTENLENDMQFKQGLLTAGVNIGISDNNIIYVDPEFTNSVNQQLGDLALQVGNIQGDITNLNQTDETLGQRIDGLDTSIENLNQSIPTNMTGASSSAAGKSGLVPAPAKGAQNKYLRGDGTWQTPPDTNTVYTAGDGIEINGNVISVSKKKVIIKLGDTTMANQVIMSPQTISAEMYRVVLNGEIVNRFKILDPVTITLLYSQTYSLKVLLIIDDVEIDMGSRSLVRCNHLIPKDTPTLVNPSDWEVDENGIPDGVDVIQAKSSVTVTPVYTKVERNGTASFSANTNVATVVFSDRICIGQITGNMSAQFTSTSGLRIVSVNLTGFTVSLIQMTPTSINANLSAIPDGEYNGTVGGNAATFTVESNTITIPYIDSVSANSTTITTKSFNTGDIVIYL